MEKQDYVPDWSNIEPEYKFVAVDANGQVCKFTHHPVALVTIHIVSMGYSDRVENIDPPGENFKNMIYKRPVDQ